MLSHSVGPCPEMLRQKYGVHLPYSKKIMLKFAKWPLALPLQPRPCKDVLAKWNMEDGKAAICLSITQLQGFRRAKTFHDFFQMKGRDDGLRREFLKKEKDGDKRDKTVGKVASDAPLLHQPFCFTL